MAQKIVILLSSASWGKSAQPKGHKITVCRYKNVFSKEENSLKADDTESREHYCSYTVGLHRYSILLHFYRASRNSSCSIAAVVNNRLC